MCSFVCSHARHIYLDFNKISRTLKCIDVLFDNASSHFHIHNYKTQCTYIYLINVNDVDLRDSVAIP
jgi:hypothetical protein